MKLIEWMNGLFRRDDTMVDYAPQPTPIKPTAKYSEFQNTKPILRIARVGTREIASNGRSKAKVGEPLYNQIIDKACVVGTIKLLTSGLSRADVGHLVSVLERGGKCYAYSLEIRSKPGEPIRHEILVKRIEKDGV